MQNQPITWAAPEFSYYEKSIGWYLAYVAVVILLASYFVYQNDWFATITIGLLGIFVAFFSVQKPQIVEVELNERSVRFGPIAYPYKQLKGFWIVNNAHHRTLNLQTSTVVNNIVVIELMDQDEDEIRNFLLRHLPEHSEIHETLAQRVSHKLKF